MMVLVVLLIMGSLDILLLGCVLTCFDKNWKNKHTKIVGYAVMAILTILLIIGGLCE